MFGKNYCAVFICILFISREIEAEDMKLESFPQSNKVWIGTENVFVSYYKEAGIKASSKSTVTVFVDDGEWIEEGSHWATVNKKDLELEEKSYSLSRSKEKIEREKLESESLRLKKDQESDLNDLEEKYRGYVDLMEDADLSSSNRERVKKIVELLDEERNKHKERILSGRIDKEIEQKKEELSLALEKEKERYFKLKHDLELKASFSGEVRYTNDKLKVGQTLWVGVNENLIDLVDDRHVELNFQARSKNIHELPADQLVINYSTRSGSFVARFNRKEWEKVGSKRERNWVFRFEEKDLSSVSKLVGERKMAHVFWKLDKPAYIISKKVLALNYPDLLEKGSWRGLVESLWKGAKILYVAPREIVVIGGKNE